MQPCIREEVGNSFCHVDYWTIKTFLLSKCAAFADVEGQNLASLLLQCAQLTDGIQQINLIKQV